MTTDSVEHADSTRTLRVLHVLVQPVLVWDDGEEMTPGPQVQPLTMPLSKTVDLASELPAQVEALAAQHATEHG